MATYYCVATGDWNDPNTWAASFGGSAPAGPPIAGDDVIFDSNSGSHSVQIAADAACDSLTTSGWSGTLPQGAGSTSYFFGGFGGYYSGSNFIGKK